MVGRRRGIIPHESPRESPQEPPLLEPVSEAAVLEAAGFVGIWDTDTRADRVRCSPAFARLYGVHPDDGLHGAPVSAFVAGCHPDDQRGLVAAITAAYAAENGLFEAEYRTIAHDGRVHWVLARGRMSVDAQRRPLASRGIVIDITDTRAAADAVEDETTQLINRLADHAIAQQHIVGKLRVPKLKQLVDTLTFEIGRELARRLRGGRGRLH